MRELDNNRFGFSDDQGDLEGCPYNYESPHHAFSPRASTRSSKTRFSIPQCRRDRAGLIRDTIFDDSISNTPWDELGDRLSSISARWKVTERSRLEILTLISGNMGHKSTKDMRVWEETSEEDMSSIIPDCIELRIPIEQVGRPSQSLR